MKLHCSTAELNLLLVVNAVIFLDSLTQPTLRSGSPV